MKRRAKNHLNLKAKRNRDVMTLIPILTQASYSLKYIRLFLSSYLVDSLASEIVHYSGSVKRLDEPRSSKRQKDDPFEMHNNVRSLFIFFETLSDYLF